MKVRVNAVAPGFMRTALLPNVLHEHQERNVYFSDPIGKQPFHSLRFLIQPVTTTLEAIANAVLYLASGTSIFCSELRITDD